MTYIFKDELLQHQFEEKGYVVVPLLSGSQVIRLWKVYQQYIRPDAITGLYESSRNNHFEINRQINTAIFEEMKRETQNLFHGHKLYGGTFMVKAAKDSEVLPLHQDWSVVEEDRYQNLFVWCPLMEVSPLNGGLFLLEGSHRFFNTIRSGSYPSNRYMILPDQYGYLTNISLKPGEAIMYSDQLFHGSYANDGDYDRVVVTGRVMEEEATLVYFHKANEQEVDVYEATPEFYLTQIDHIAKGLAPRDIPKLYSRSYRHLPVTHKSLQQKIKEKFSEKRYQQMKNFELFNDPSLQDEFDKDGYVVIDLIGEKEITALRSFYDNLENAPVPEYGFQVSLDNTNHQYVKNVTETLIGAVTEGVERYFHNHKIFTASFVVKEPNPLGVVPPHQDWTFVDEQEYWSATIWCPLVDVDMHNGALGVIKGSHRFYDHIRPSPSPHYKPPFAGQLFDIFPYLKLIELKAGQALVFNNQTLHGSPPNTTDHTRLSFGIGITHKDAVIRHYYLLPDRTEAVVEGFEVPEDFFYYYNNARLAGMYDINKKPEGLKSIGTFSYQYRHYETEQLIRSIELANNHKDYALTAKMADLFGYNMDGTLKERGREGHELVETGSLPFWKVYTPMNVFREIKYRLSKR